jgi:hypothetical protein
MGANQLLASDVVLQAGALNAVSVTLSAEIKESKVLEHAEASLRNAKAMAGVN